MWMLLVIAVLGLAGFGVAAWCMIRAVAASDKATAAIIDADFAEAPRTAELAGGI